MNKYLLIVFLLFTSSHFAQTLSKTSILYESKNQVVLNNGKKYTKLVETPFYEIKDTAIKKHIQVADHLLRLNRIFILKTGSEYVELIEWVKEKMSFYEYRELSDSQMGINYLLDSEMLIETD